VEGPGSFDDHPDKQLFRVEPEIKGVPVRDLLGWFDIGTTEITGKVQLAGKLEFSGKSAAERKRNLNGAFRLRVEDGVARRFQLMVRILSFLDLSRWFTLRLPNASQEGIHFRSISADVKVAQGIYSTQNLFVDGDDLRITGAGELDGPKGEINFVITVRPFPGIDTAANYIPILGTGLAAIKNVFLVASFNVKGPINDPSITPAPLSTLSEYFFGVLAIPKGLIGLPTTGEPKPNTGRKPTTDEKPTDEQPS
ncbi:MAG: AsmA-like C-terminal region-containing protein, partial [Candidatus Binatia bacterium]